MQKDRIRLCIEKDGTIYKLTSIYLLKDGSFKIDVPYCNYNKGSITKFRMRYGPRYSEISEDRWVQEFTLTNRPQLSIHASGFVQFSGKGIISGIDKSTGKVKGAGLQSAPLTTPIQSGPTFSVQIWGLQHFDKKPSKSSEDFIYIEKDFTLRENMKGGMPNTYLFEGWIFPSELYSKYIKNVSGYEEITMIFPHYRPSPYAIFTLRVVRLYSVKSFIAILPIFTDTKFPIKNNFGFIINTPSEQSRKSDGEAEMMFAIFPNNLDSESPTSLDKYGDYL